MNTSGMLSTNSKVAIQRFKMDKSTRVNNILIVKLRKSSKGILENLLYYHKG
jgi:hypothetical protein